MKTLKLTKDDFKKADNYGYKYIGKEDLSDFEGNLEIDIGLKEWLQFEGSIVVSGYISIEAGDWIEAGGSIKAGGSIEAKFGITAGLQITCKTLLKFGLRIFAGTAPWSWVNDEHKKITCGKLEGETVAYGMVIETGLPTETSLSGKVVKVELDGKSYDAVIK